MTADINIFGIIPDLLFYLENYVVCTHRNHLDEAILMSTHNIHCTFILFWLVGWLFWVWVCIGPSPKEREKEERNDR